MEAIKPFFIFEDQVDGEKILVNLERYARTCYKSEDKIGPGSAAVLIKGLIKNGHESVIEHEKITVRVVCDRGITHEIVRHRLASYSQESTRYCDYNKSGSIVVIEPFFFQDKPEQRQAWQEAMMACEQAYNKLRELGASPQEARTVLPNSLKTEIVITYNLRAWRHFFKLRTSKASHPQMREIAIPLLREMQKKVPVIFDDIIIED